MYLSDTQAVAEPGVQRRQHVRNGIQCRARIRIGTRHYAGYLHNISEGGAKLRTITPIRKPGKVILTLPDLTPMHCQLRWTDAFNAGVSFERPLAPEELSGWVAERGSLHRGYRSAEITELPALTS